MGLWAWHQVIYCEGSDLRIFVIKTMDSKYWSIKIIKKGTYTYDTIICSL